MWISIMKKAPFHEILHKLLVFLVSCYVYTALVLINMNTDQVIVNTMLTGFYIL